MSMSAEKLLLEARARIIWGEPSSTVRDFLIANGVSGQITDAKLKEFELERRQELRRIGFRNVLLGVVLSGMAGFALYMAFFIASATSGIIKAVALVVLVGIYGLWKLVKGVVYLVRPQSERRSIPDIVQADPLE